MKITRLSWAVIEANYDWTIVRLDAEGGLHGIGEAYMGPGLTAVLSELRTLVVGSDAFQIEAIIRRLRGCTSESTPALPLFRRRSEISKAVFCRSHRADPRSSIGGGNGAGSSIRMR